MSDDLLQELVDEVRELRRQVKRQATAGGAGEPARDLLWKREVARRLRCRVHTVYALIASGQLEVVNCGTTEKIRAADVARLAREGWTTPAAAKPKRPRSAKPTPATGPQTAAELVAAIRAL